MTKSMRVGTKAQSQRIRTMWRERAGWGGFGRSGAAWLLILVALTGGLSLSVTNVAQAQTNSPATGAPTISGFPQVGYDVTADTTGIADSDGLPSTYDYQWIRVVGSTDTDITGATSGTYRVVAADLGKTLKLRVSFTDGGGNAETLTSAATAAAAAAPAACTPGNVWCGIITVGQADFPGAVDDKGYCDASDTSTTTPCTSWEFGNLSSDEFLFEGHFQKIEGIREGGDRNLYFSLTVGLLSDDTLIVNVGTRSFKLRDALHGNNNDQYQSSYRWTNGNGVIFDKPLGIRIRAELEKVRNTPATGAPSITGAATVGQGLTAGQGTIADANGLPSGTFPTGYSFQWVRVDGTTENDISGATSRTYTLTAADNGKRVKVEVSFEDGNGYAETRTSVAYPSGMSAIGAANSAATGAPTIVGIAKVGRTLTASPGAWLEDDNGLPAFPTGYTFQWIRIDGSTETNISGAMSETYTLVNDDNNKQVRVRLSFTDQNGYSETKTSEKYPRREKRILGQGRTSLEPTVLRPESGYYSDKAMTQPLRSGTRRSLGQDIWVKVRFSRHMAVVVGNDASEARPQIFYKIGDSAPVQFRMMSYEYYTQQSGECRRADPKKVAETNEFRCRYTVTGDDEGAFTFEVGTESEAPGWPRGALYERYTHGETLPVSPLPAHCDPEDSRELWCAVLTVGEIRSGGTLISYGFTTFNNIGTLTDTDFVHDGTRYAVAQLRISTRQNPILTVRFSPEGGSVFDNAGFRLVVGSAEFSLDDAIFTDSIGFRWNNSGLSWSAGDTVAVRLLGPEGSSMQVEGDPPTVEGTPTVSAAGADAQWSEGETIEVTVRFNEPVNVETTNGTPTIGIELGGIEARSAAYLRGSGTAALVFGYTLAPGDGSHDFMAVTPDSLALNGGTIRSSETAFDALLGHLGAAVLGTNARGAGPQASFHDVPDSHDGESAFTLTVAFGGAPDGLTPKRDAASAIETTGGTITKARNAPRSSAGTWELTVTPSGPDDITLQIPARGCHERGAICVGGRALAEPEEVTISGVKMNATVIRTAQAQAVACHSKHHSQAENAQVGSHEPERLHRGKGDQSQHGQGAGKPVDGPGKGGGVVVEMLLAVDVRVEMGMHQ